MEVPHKQMGDTESPLGHHFPNELILLGVPQADTALFSREHVCVSVLGGNVDLNILTTRDIRRYRYVISFDSGHTTGYGITYATCNTPEVITLVQVASCMNTERKPLSILQMPAC